MSEKKSINLIVIAVISTAIIALQFQMFLTYGVVLDAEIAAESINLDTAILFFFGLISLILMSLSLILIAVEMLLETDKINAVKISSLFILISVILFLIEVIVGTLEFLGVL